MKATCSPPRIRRRRRIRSCSRLAKDVGASGPESQPDAPDEHPGSRKEPVRARPPRRIAFVAAGAAGSGFVAG